ncbi:MAG: cell division protein ZapA [Oscillospiraceae bacterium]
MSLNKLLLTIAGLSILINTDEDEAYTRELAEELDRDINTILSANMGASVTNSALLCAIDYLDIAKKSGKNATNMRNQVKDYMDEAAKAKFKFDEEHRRANELTVEIQSLRSHLTRLATEGDSSGVVENIKSELTAATAELSVLREKSAALADANRTLNEKSGAMSDFIAGQDRELARMSSIVGELNATVSKKDELLSSLASRIESVSNENRALKSESARINSQLAELEQSINLERSRSQNLYTELEAAKLDAAFAIEEAKKLKQSFFVPSDVFAAPLSDELESSGSAKELSGEPSDDSVDIPRDSLHGESSGVRSFIPAEYVDAPDSESNHTSSESLPEAENLSESYSEPDDGSFVFNSFHVIDDEPEAHAALNEIKPTPASEETLLSYEPIVEDLDEDSGAEESPDMPDLSWTLEL